MIISKSILRQDVSLSVIYTKLIFESISNKRTEAHFTHSDTWVFLSHKHSEGDILAQVITLLRNHGANVYVDWMDHSMSAITDASTAIQLKKKINDCNKFILVATEDAIASKWCNWELGIGDVKRFSEHIAIFPIANDGQNFSGAEYLRIYPSIERVETGDYPDRSSYHVKFPGSDRIDSLKSWLLKK